VVFEKNYTPYKAAMYSWSMRKISFFADCTNFFNNLVLSLKKSFFRAFLVFFETVHPNKPKYHILSIDIVGI